MARLGDIAEISAGQSAPQGDSNYCQEGIPFVKAANLLELLSGKSIEDIQKISSDVAKKHRLKLFTKGTVLFAKSGMSCLKGYVYALPTDSYVVNHLACITPQMDISDFLVYYFTFHRPNQLVKDAAYPSISLSDIANMEIDLKTNEIRLNIVSILDKLSGLISLRKRQLAKLDELVKARFVEMFGEPVCNSKKLPTERGVNFFKLSNGKFVPESRRLETGIPAYGGNGISWYTDDAIMTRDTLVVGRVGFQSGNVHFAKGPLWITDNAMYISAYNAEKFDLFFLYSLMEHIDFTRFQDAGDLKKITQKPFMSMEYIMPPLSLQREYVAFAEQTDKSKLTIQQSLDKMEVLKKALMQEYFGGGCT